jgi:putative Mg2+ transporter-C (MgtC) family protein
MLEYSDILLRLTTATLSGAALGLNRELSGKQMGIRTLGLVGLGSAMAVLAADNFSPDSASRVVQGVVTGIGFLGAGVIVREVRGHRVHGLTTAACAWATASIGILCGFGSWRILFVALPLMVFLLVVGGPIERWIYARWGGKGGLPSG